MTAGWAKTSPASSRLWLIVAGCLLVFALPRPAAAEIDCRDISASQLARSYLQDELPSLFEMKEGDRQRRDQLLLQIEAWVGSRFETCGRDSRAYRHGLQTYHDIVSTTFKLSRSRYFADYLKRLDSGQTVWLDDEPLEVLWAQVKLLKTGGYKRLAARLQEIMTYRLAVERPPDYRLLYHFSMTNAEGQIGEGEGYGSHEWSDHAMLYLPRFESSPLMLIRSRMLNGDILTRRYRYQLAAGEYQSALRLYTDDFTRLNAVDPAVLDHLAKASIDNTELTPSFGLASAHQIMASLPYELTTDDQRRLAHTASYMHIVTGRMDGHGFSIFNRMWQGSALEPFLEGIKEGRFGAAGVGPAEVYANFLQFAWAHLHPGEETIGTGIPLAPIEVGKLIDPVFRARVFTSLTNLSDAKFSEVEAAYMRAEGLTPGVFTDKARHSELLSLLKNRARIEHYYEELSSRSSIHDFDSSLRLFEIAKENEDAIALLVGEDLPDVFLPPNEAAKSLKPANLTGNVDLDEAALLVFDGNIGMHVVLVTSRDIVWHMTPERDDEIDRLVDSLRYSLDQQPESAGYYKRDFDFRAAQELYQAILLPLVPYLEGKTRLLVYSSGDFSRIPSGLIGYSPDKDTLEEGDYREDFVFLMDRFEIVQFTGIEDLVRRQETSKYAKSHKDIEFLGFGNPTLTGEAYTRGLEVFRSGEGDQRFIVHDFAQRRSLADPEALRGLRAVPGTLRELELVEDIFTNSRTLTFTGNAATESAVKSADYANARIVSFATHGFAEGEGILEAGLVLTPPAHPSDLDDGFLVASEIRALSIPAELVILSACDTATGRTRGGPFSSPQGPAFEGLVTAFRAAGARQVLATHWPLRDDAAPEIMQQMFEIRQDQPSLTYSAALRRAVLEFRTRYADDPEYSHPAVWGPFTLVGL